MKLGKLNSSNQGSRAELVNICASFAGMVLQDLSWSHYIVSFTPPELPWSYNVSHNWQNSRFTFDSFSCMILKLA